MTALNCVGLTFNVWSVEMSLQISMICMHLLSILLPSMSCCGDFSAIISDDGLTLFVCDSLTR